MSEAHVADNCSNVSISKKRKIDEISGFNSAEEQEVSEGAMSNKKFKMNNGEASCHRAGSARSSKQIESQYIRVETSNQQDISAENLLDVTVPLQQAESQLEVENANLQRQFEDKLRLSEHHEVVVSDEPYLVSEEVILSVALESIAIDQIVIPTAELASFDEDVAILVILEDGQMALANGDLIQEPHYVDAPPQD